jgi:hypothetical protein
LLAFTANLYPEMFDIQSFLIQEGIESNPLWDLGGKWADQITVVDSLRDILKQWDTNPTLVSGVLTQLMTTLSTCHVEEHASCIMEELMEPCLNGR